MGFRESYEDHQGLVVWMILSVFIFGVSWFINGFILDNNTFLQQITFALRQIGSLSRMSILAYLGIASIISFIISLITFLSTIED